MIFEKINQLFYLSPDLIFSTLYFGPYFFMVIKRPMISKQDRCILNRRSFKYNKLLIQMAEFNFQPAGRRNWCKNNGSTWLRVAGGQGGWGVARILHFGRSGNPISTGGQIMQSHYYSAPHDFQTFRHPCTFYAVASLRCVMHRDTRVRRTAIFLPNSPISKNS